MGVGGGEETGGVKDDVQDSDLVGGLLSESVIYWLWKKGREVGGAHGHSEMAVSQQTRYIKWMIGCGSLGIP